jgi:hypothetical protein
LFLLDDAYKRLEPTRSIAISYNRREISGPTKNYIYWEEKTMKKFVGIILVVLMAMTVATALANNDPIWDNVYEYWKDLHTDEYNKFVDTEYYYDGQGFVDNGVAYYASNNCSLYYDEVHSVEEIQKHVEESCAEIGIKHYTCSVNCIGKSAGRKILRLAINTAEDLTKIKEANCNFDEPVYGLVLICYDKICEDY